MVELIIHLVIHLMVNHYSNQSLRIALPEFFTFYVYRIDYVAFSCLCFFNMILWYIAFNICVGVFSLLSSPCVFITVPVEIQQILLFLTLVQIRFSCPWAWFKQWS